MSPAPVVAIDGPSASGKGTVAQRVARELGFRYLDSGSLYRLVALAAMREGVNLADEARLSRLAERLPVRFDGAEVSFGGEQVTEAIRSEACSLAASQVAALPAVRNALLGWQHRFREPPGLVAE